MACVPPPDFCDVSLVLDLQIVSNMTLRNPCSLLLVPFDRASVWCDKINRHAGTDAIELHSLITSGDLAFVGSAQQGNKRSLLQTAIVLK